MKILMTADALGGVWTYVLELSAALAQHDVQVLLATMGPPLSASQRERALEVRNLRLQCSNYKLEWMHEPWDDVERAGAWLRALAEREAVDVVHLNGYAHAALSWSQPVLVAAHSCMWTRWQAVNRCQPPAEWSVYRRKVADGLQHASYIVAPTQAFLEQIRHLYQPTSPSSVIYNARSDGFCTRTEPHKRQPVIFASGRLWDEARSIRVLDTAVRGLSWRAYISGTGSAVVDGKYVRVTALRCLDSLAPHDAAAWLKRAAIFVHPTRYEPSGFTVLEAALAGCALVLSDLPALRELWEGAALFVDPDDAAGFKRALSTLIAQPHRRLHLSSIAQERARQYSPEVMASDYAALYRSLLTGRQHVSAPSREAAA